MLSRPSSLLRPPPTPSRLPATSRSAGYRQTNSSSPQDEGRGGPLQLPRQLSSHSTFLTPEGSSIPAPRTQASSMAFAHRRRARHPLALLSQAIITTLQTSLHVADCDFDSPRFDAGISTNAGGFTTEGPWRLLGPDSHRLSHRDLVARLRHVDSFVLMAPELLDAPSDFRIAAKRPRVTRNTVRALGMGHSEIWNEANERFRRSLSLPSGRPSGRRVATCADLLLGEKESAAEKIR